MITLENFKLDLKKIDSFESIKNLKISIDNLVNQKIFLKQLSLISNLLDIDLDILQLKAKRILVSKFNYKKNRFNKISKIHDILKEFIIFLYLFLRLVFAFKKKREIKNIELILCNIQSIDEIEKFKNILNKFESSLIVSEKKSFNFERLNKDLKPRTDINIRSRTDIQDEYLVENLSITFHNNKLDLNFKDKNEKISINTDIVTRRDAHFQKECIKDKFKLFKIGFIVMYYSLRERFNFLYFFNRILFSYASNFSIFTNYKAKYLLQDRIYTTCPIRNYLFKKMGGKITSCVQSHITEGSINLFNDTDLLFSFGDEEGSIKNLTEMGSRISKSIPVGSLRHEEYCLNACDNFSSKEKIDILVFGVNINDWYYSNELIQKSYYDFIKLIGLISIKYKNLNIRMKHHPNNFDDSIEREILKNSNVKYVEKITNSYRYLKTSKLFFSFSSSMVCEAFAQGKVGYFINTIENNLFFKNNNNFKKIILRDFNQIEEIIQKDIIGKKEMINNFSDICLKSGKVSESIFQNLKTQKL